MQGEVTDGQALQELLQGTAWKKQLLLLFLVKLATTGSGFKEQL